MSEVMVPEPSNAQEHAAPHGVAKAPCKSRPYRQDVPSGVWDAAEYLKLPCYDGEILEQLQGGATGLFLCHQQDGSLCAGWLACHGPHNLLAMRLAGDRVARAAWAYGTATPVFGSGAEAAAHGLADVPRPSAKAQRTIERLLLKANARDGSGTPS